MLPSLGVAQAAAGCRLHADPAPPCLTAAFPLMPLVQTRAPQCWTASEASCTPPCPLSQRSLSLRRQRRRQRSRLATRQPRPAVQRPWRRRRQQEEQQQERQRRDGTTLNLATSRTRLCSMRSMHSSRRSSRSRPSRRRRWPRCSPPCRSQSCLQRRQLHLRRRRRLPCPWACSGMLRSRWICLARNLPPRRRSHSLRPTAGARRRPWRPQRRPRPPRSSSSRSLASSRRRMQRQREQ